jgi:hypothetical protein
MLIAFQTWKSGGLAELAYVSFVRPRDLSSNLCEEKIFSDFVFQISRAVTLEHHLLVYIKFKVLLDGPLESFS